MKKSSEKSVEVKYADGEETLENPAGTLSNLRYLILALFCILASAVVISCEQPLPLQEDIIKDLHISTTQYTVLVASFTLPNIVFPIIGGHIFDTIGRGLCLVLFSSAMFLGQTLIAFGGTANNYNLILFGRIINSLGGDNLNVTISGYLFYWYKGQRLGMPMAIMGITGLLASALCYMTTPILYNIHHELSFPLWVAFLFCAVALICGMLAGALTKYGERKGLINEQEIQENADISRIWDFSHYKPVFWLVTVIAFFAYGAVFSVMGIASGFIQEKYKFTNVNAGLLLSAPQISVLFFFPIFGKLVDRCGMLSAKFIGAGILLATSMIYFAFSPECNQCLSVLPGSLLFGVSYALFVPTLWASPGLIVEKNAIGLAYGFIGAARNLGVSLVTITAGVIRDNSHGYLNTMLFLSAVGVMAFVSTVLMTIYDCLNGQYLHRPNPTPAIQSEV